MGNKRIRVLLVEDSPTCAQLVQEMLSSQQDQPFEIVWVETLRSAVDQLNGGGIDVILLDLLLPDSAGSDTFLNVHSHAPGIPIVVLTGTGNEHEGIIAVSKGAQDYVMKWDFDGRLLARAIRYAIERQNLTLKLQESRSEVNKLTGLLPMCAHCKKIKDDQGYWNAVEKYISEHSSAQLTHGICPECIRSLYPEIADKLDLKRSERIDTE